MAHLTDNCCFCLDNPFGFVSYFSYWDNMTSNNSSSREKKFVQVRSSGVQSIMAEKLGCAEVEALSQIAS